MKLRVFSFFLIMILFFCFGSINHLIVCKSSLNSSNEMSTNRDVDGYYYWINAEVKRMNLQDNIAYIDINIIGEFPSDKTLRLLHPYQMLSGNLAEERSEELHEIYAKNDTFPIVGVCEEFPFDSYKIILYLPSLIEANNLKVKFIENYSIIAISKILYPTWELHPELIKKEKSMETSYSKSGYTECAEITKYEISVSRKFLVPFFQIIFPIILCYFLLGCTIFIPYQKYENRLIVYVPLFIFSPTFLLAIQLYLPICLSLSFPSFLLLYLTVCIVCLAIASIISSYFKKDYDFFGLLIAELFLISTMFLFKFSNLNYFLTLVIIMSAIISPKIFYFFYSNKKERVSYDTTKFEF